MTDKEKQIKEIKDAIDSVYCDDCDYYGVDGFAIAEELYSRGYRKQSGWISVDERLPERMGAYLAYTFRGYTKISHFEMWAIGEAPCFDDYTITHWMPLPEPPRMKGGASDDRN